MKIYKKIDQLLSLSYLKYANKTFACGKKDMPALFCNTSEYPDFLALYSEPGLYHKTRRTAVCFYQFDQKFHKRDGLYEAIYYDDINLLDYYRKRFAGVKFFISPDYSILGDIHRVENEYRIFRARIVSLWLMAELDAVVIPNISFVDDNGTVGFELDGLEKCSVVAFSTKGHIQGLDEFERLKLNVRLTVDRLSLKAIIVYDDCGTREKTLEAFDYAASRGIEIVIPNNTLKQRNTLRKKAS